MKKRIAVILAVVLMLSVLPVGCFAKSGDTLTVQTRSSEYVFHVGDTFTYSYWLSLKPDVVSYSQEYLDELIGASFGSDRELFGLRLTDLTDTTLKSVSGNIKYDTDCLALVSATTPNIKLGITKQKSDAMGGTVLDGTLFDFTNADLAFFSNIMTKSEKAQFSQPKVLVQCSFRVLSGSDTPVYLRTKLTHLEVTTKKLGDLVDKKDIKLVHGRTTFFPYESFETVNDEKPTVVLKSLVDDVGLDIRYLNLSGDPSQYRRPGAGVTARMMGFSSDGRYLRLEQQTDGSEVMWFYDVPYGQYYVDCSFTDEQGRFYATPDPEKAEHINVPATGEIQALWLIQTQPSETMQLNVYVDWKGDEGYLPARPEYLYLQLYNEQDPGGLVLQQQILQRTDTHTSFDNVNIYDRSGEPIGYKLIVSAEGDSFAQYKYSVDRKGNAFYVTAEYFGSPEDLGKIPVDAGGHYWVELESRLPTCTTEGRAYYVCDVCHETKYVTVPANGHSTVLIPAVAPSCTKAGKTSGLYCIACGEIIEAPQPVPATGHTVAVDKGYPASCTESGLSDGSHCLACGTVLTEQKTVPALGHSYEARVTQPSCTAKGFTAHVCTVCGDSYASDWVNALGHTYANGVCTRCGENDPAYKPVLTNPFVDVSDGHFYTDAVLWAYHHTPKQITGGTDAAHFSPDAGCTRAQVVTFLWRAAGCPEPIGTDNPFVDVINSGRCQPFYKAILWAAENGITNGVDRDHFAPYVTVNRGQVVTFLWRYDGCRAAKSAASPFVDVRNEGSCRPYYSAILWAAENGITRGTDASHFEPFATVTRAQVVTFLYRYMQ